MKLRAFILWTIFLWMISAVLALPKGAAQDQPQDPKQNQKQEQNDNQTPALKPRPDPNSRTDSAKDTAPARTEPYTDEDGLIHRPNPGSSSSKTETIDLSPPDDDAKTHPNSGEAVREAEDAAGLLQDDELGGIQEFHPWDPHKSQKDIEVGDYYFRQGNYFGALSRYQEALYYKNGDAIATYKIAVCQEKTGESDDARKGYEAYLKLLPEGPLAADARKALARLGPADKSENQPDGGKSDPATAKPPALEKR